MLTIGSLFSGIGGLELPAVSRGSMPWQDNNPCMGCGGTGFSDGWSPPLVDPADPLHPYGRCTCHGEMSPDCDYCRHICRTCFGDGKSPSPGDGR